MAISQLLNANQIINIASEYRSWYNLTEKEEDEIKKIIIEKGNKKFYIFRYIAIVKNFLILSKKLKFTVEIPAVRERFFMEELNKACYVKVLKRRTINNALYSNEILTTLDVYY